MTFVGELGQWLGVLLFMSGITVEIVYQADAGFILITCAAFLFTIATKLKHEKRG